MASMLAFSARLHPASSDGNLFDAEYRDIKVPAAEVGLILIDLWDRHPCPSMSKRGDILAKHVAPVVSALRDLGGLIIHAPSDLVPYPDDYEHHKARNRFLEGWKHVVDGYGRVGLETFPWPLCQDGCEGRRDGPKWRRQHQRIWIDERDIIVKENPDPPAVHESQLLLDYLRQKNIRHLVYAGAATNECVLWTRNTSISTMHAKARERNQGLAIYVARDLTDTMYVPPVKDRAAPGALDGCNRGKPWGGNVAPPWEVHDSGTVATVAWIERNLRVPSILSSDLITPS